jgi:hypothetical protein
MPTLASRNAFWFLLLLSAAVANSQDLRVKKSINVDGKPVFTTEILIKGPREHIATQSPAGTLITLKQCDLKRTVTLNEDTQSFFVADDPQDEVATAAQPADASAYIAETSVVKDTAERKPMFGLTARHLKTSVTVKSSENACTKVNQKFEVDGWYADLPKEQSVCQASLPPVHQDGGCNDRIVRSRTGTGKLGYPLKELITLHKDDGTTSTVNVQLTNLAKQSFDPEVFDVPDGYHEVKSLAELSGAPSKTQLAALTSAVTSPATATGGSPSVAAKSSGKVRIGVAPPEAQMGQGNNSGADYSTPIRGAEIALMSGPAVEIMPLDSHVPMQLQAEAKQKQCDFVMYSSVSVTHGQATGFGKFAKYGTMAASMTPMGVMAHGMGAAAAAQAAAAAASQMAQQQAVNQLAGFNGQIKSKDDVTVQYQLVAAGQTAPLLQNTLQGKAKSNGEDVLTPLLQQAATSVLTEVSKK